MLIGHAYRKGILASCHICDTCGEHFSITPPVNNTDWPNCLADECDSYDASRDLSKMIEQGDVGLGLKSTDPRLYEVVPIPKHWPPSDGA